MTATFILPLSLREKIVAEARAAFPRECCGLLEGVRDGDVVSVIALHSAKNLSTDDDRFEIDPADHFAAQRAARAAKREIIGCYHSHPNGKPEPSVRDSDRAWDEGFVWLIAAIGERVELCAHVRQSPDWKRLEIAEKLG